MHADPLPAREKLLPSGKPAVEAGLLLLATLAYLTHLDHFQLSPFTDEARRALVTAEMLLSGNYLVPTLNGELYLNKPPMYNWIVALCFRVSGDYSMFAFRLPVILASLATSFTIFYFFKKYISRPVAVFTALAFFTNGRILFYDSLQGLIDTSFSWLVILNFFLIYHLGKQNRFLLLFVISYLLTAVGFMMKGLPAVVFQGFTLLTYFLFSRQFYQLFRPAHFIGIASFLLPLVLYYLLYFQSSGLEPKTLFANLFTESSKRTAVKFGWRDTVIHLFTFPFEMVYHFLPWTIFVLAAFAGRTRQKIKDNHFLHFLFWTFTLNIIVYWTSVEVFARYLFMFLPFLYGACFYLYHLADRQSTAIKILHALFKIIIGAALAGVIVLPFLPAMKHLPYLLFKVAGLGVMLSLALYIAIFRSRYQVYALVFTIILIRFAFNWVVLENRSTGSHTLRAEAETIHKITGGEELYLLKNVEAGNFDAMSFHLSTLKESVLTYSDKTDTSSYFIADPSQLKQRPHIVYFVFSNYLAPDSLRVVRFTSR